MPTFALQELKELSSKLRIYKLLIDNACEYDAFETQIQLDGTYASELVTIQTRLIEIAECKSLPKEKFKDITPRKEPIKEYEIKTRNLRVYLFHEANTGRVIVLGGKKTDQKSDIKRFRRIKKDYFNQKNK
jgi:hypothetical protein